jgi:hypothetical protein
MSTTSDVSNARAVKLVATNCAICTRPLRDSVSVEAGIGPECRKRYGYNLKVPQKLRAEANMLVHDIAIQQSGPEVLQAANRLRMLGFVKLADAISVTRADVIITQEEGEVLIRAPYSEAATAAFRSVPGRRWCSKEKVNRFPVNAKRRLLDVLRTCYPGSWAVGPRGAFRLDP